MSTDSMVVSPAGYLPIEVDELGDWNPTVQFQDPDTGLPVTDFFASGDKAYWAVAESFGGDVLFLMGPASESFPDAISIDVASSMVTGAPLAGTMLASVLGDLTKDDPGWHELVVFRGGVASGRQSLLKGPWHLSRGVVPAAPAPLE